MADAGEIHPLYAIEEEGWRALCTSGEAAADFYRDVLAEDVTMVFPGFVVADRQQVIDSMGGSPWSSFTLRDKRAMDVGDVVFLTYASTSKRGDDPEYNALITSAYVRRDGEWRLAFHQQTPS